MGEKWFEFVKRIKKEGNHESLKDAMKEASKRKSEWNGGADTGMKKKTLKTKKSKGKRAKKSKKTRKVRKSRKMKKSKK